MDFVRRLNSTKYYTLKDSDYIIDKVYREAKTITNNKSITYYNIPCAFDIETTSFFRSNGNEKAACMYIWMFGLNGYVIVGRTWEEYINLTTKIINIFNTWEKTRLIIYVHFLEFDFQFFRKWFTWKKVFSTSRYKPIYALDVNGLEYRCSYKLSGYSLAKIGDDLQKYKVNKKVGDLDYSKIRHSSTKLTTAEMGYCINDCKVVMAYIQERIENDGDITKIPLTKTGYVRNYCRKNCFGNTGRKSHKRLKYMELMQSMRLTVDEYKQLKRAFQGGFTHANPFCSGRVIQNVTSFDFTSSYPCVMVSEKFPVSSSEKIDIFSIEQLEYNCKKYCCVFDIELNEVYSTVFFESYISESRCSKLINAVINNGRVVSADMLQTTITEQDYYIIKKMYTWNEDRVYIRNFRRYKRGYLPTDFIKSILTLYRDKTQLKGVEGKEVDYLRSKEMINSCYGMAVTDVVKDEVEYNNNEWAEEIKRLTLDEIESKLIKYNNSSARFLFYPWGVWVTAYARANLFSGILEFSNDYVYSDTDSIKVINVEKHKEYLAKYNNIVLDKLYKAMKHHGLDIAEIAPKTIKGVEKPLGVWDFDGHYRKFKTLGAKRYLVEYSDDERNGISKDKQQLTVSGLNKKVCLPYLQELYGNEIWEAFNNELHIPASNTGKNTHTYINTPISGKLIDCNGIAGYYFEKSYVHLEPADYTLSMSQEYVDYILGIQTI